MLMIDDLYKIRNYLPIIYLGFDDLIATKLVLIFGKLREIKKIDYFLVFDGKNFDKFKYDFIISKRDYEKCKKYFRRACWFEEIPGKDAVSKFLQENKITFDLETLPMADQNKCCYVGKMDDYLIDLPLIQKKINKICNFEEDISNAISRCDVVVGRDSESLLIAAHHKKKIYLIADEKIGNSFQMMFPGTIIVKN